MKSVISVALKTPLEQRLGLCIYKTSLLHRPDDHIGFTPSCPPTFATKLRPCLQCHGEYHLQAFKKSDCAECTSWTHAEWGIQIALISRAAPCTDWAKPESPYHCCRTKLRDCSRENQETRT